MPTRNVSLTREQDGFVARLVDRGEYQNASEAIRDALRALQQRRREDAARITALRAALRDGDEALERGDFVELERHQIGGFVRELARAGSERPPERTARRRRRPR